MHYAHYCMQYMYVCFLFCSCWWMHVPTFPCLFPSRNDDGRMWINVLFGTLYIVQWIGFGWGYRFCFVLSYTIPQKCCIRFSHSHLSLVWDHWILLSSYECECEEKKQIHLPYYYRNKRESKFSSTQIQCIYIEESNKKKDIRTTVNMNTNTNTKIRI